MRCLRLGGSIGGICDCISLFLAKILAMVAFAKKKYYTVEEYLDLEERSGEKHEYYDGKLITMPGGTHIHNEIAAKIISLLIVAAKQLPKKYKVYTSDMKIQIPEWKAFVYPDAVVVCEKPELWEGRKDVIVNPLLIVEVASPTTKGYDRSVKFDKYRTLPSFKEYLLVMQTMPEVSQYSSEEKDLWRTTTHRGLDGKIQLRSLGCEMNLADIYEDIEFPPEEERVLSE